MEKVYNGEEPDDVLQEIKLTTPSGENPEALIKAYKWIWGQEDVNNPTGKGRDMSWEGWKIVKGIWHETYGIKDLFEEIKEQK